MIQLSRRQFSTVVGAAVIGSAASRGAFGFHRSPSSELNIAFIGVGGRGGSNLQTIASDANVKVAAICDVDARKLEAAGKRFPEARRFADFRKLYENVDSVDAVVVSTAEHTHAYATLPALRLGKHVYCEKPLTHNIAEARIVAEAAAKAGTATQMGTQIHASKNYHEVVHLIRAGVIGEVSEVHVWVGRAWGLQSKAAAELHKDITFVTERPKEKMAVPDYLDWDLWLGPAPYRPFHSIYFPGPNWYRWWDFGSGTMSDLGSHWNDLPFWALELDAPTQITASGPPAHPEIAPASMSASYQYPARGQRPALMMTWYQGEMKPKQWTEKQIPQWDSGCLFVGSEGLLLSDYGKHLLLPEDKDWAAHVPELANTAPLGHHQEWLDACRTGAPTGSPFSYAGPLIEANHLGNVAYRSGKTIQWDAASQRIPNSPDAEKFLSRAPRDGWTLDV